MTLFTQTTANMDTLPKKLPKKLPKTILDKIPLTCEIRRMLSLEKVAYSDIPLGDLYELLGNCCSFHCLEHNCSGSIYYVDGCKTQSGFVCGERLRLEDYQGDEEKVELTASCYECGCRGPDDALENDNSIFMVFDVNDLPQDLMNNWDWLFNSAPVAHCLKFGDLGPFEELCKSDQELARCFRNQFLKAARESELPLTLWWRE